MAQLDQYELEAIQEWVKYRGRDWRRDLYYSWANGNYHGFAKSHILQSIRNRIDGGPEWLDKFNLKAAQEAGLRKLQQEMDASRCDECGCTGGWHYDSCPKGDWHP